MEWVDVVAEAAFDMGENQGKEGGQVNIGPRNVLHALAVLSARATMSFFRQLSEKLAQLSWTQLCNRLSPPFQSDA